MILEDIKEQIDSNVCQSFSPPPSTSTPAPPSPQPPLHEVTPLTCPHGSSCPVSQPCELTYLNGLTLFNITNIFSLILGLHIRLFYCGVACMTGSWEAEWSCLFVDCCEPLVLMVSCSRRWSPALPDVLTNTCRRMEPVEMDKHRPAHR